MCLAVPLEIEEIRPDGKAMVRQGDGQIEVDVSLIDSPQVGDYVLIHAGFAIDTIDLQEATERIAMLRELRVDAAG